jgi:hypothetical protein
MGRDSRCQQQQELFISTVCRHTHTEFCEEQLEQKGILASKFLSQPYKLLRKRKISGIYVLLPTTISSAGNILMTNKTWMHSLDLQLKGKMVRGGFPSYHGSFHNACCVVYLSTACV